MHAYLNVNPPVISRVAHVIFLLNSKGRKSVGGRLRAKSAPSTLPSYICIVKVQMSSLNMTHMFGERLCKRPWGGQDYLVI